MSRLRFFGSKSLRAECRPKPDVTSRRVIMPTSLTRAAAPLGKVVAHVLERAMSSALRRAQSSKMRSVDDALKPHARYAAP